VSYLFARSFYSLAKALLTPLIRFIRGYILCLDSLSAYKRTECSKRLNNYLLSEAKSRKNWEGPHTELEYVKVNVSEPLLSPFQLSLAFNVNPISINSGSSPVRLLFLRRLPSSLRRYLPQEPRGGHAGDCELPSVLW
jgi:hypothetical protein